MPTRRLFDGAQRQLGLLPFVYASGFPVNGNASGSDIFGTVAVTTAAGAATGSVSTSGTLPTTSLTAPVGTASSSVLASGLFSSIQVSSLAGFASASSLIFVSLPTVNIPASWFIGEESGTLGSNALGGSPVSAGSRRTAYQLYGYAEVVAMAYGDFPTVSISTANGSATGSSSVSAQIATVSIVSVAGSATGSALANRPLATVQITAPAAIGSGSATTSGVFGSVSLVSQNGAASGGATGAGGFAAIAIVGMEATVEVTNFIRASVVVSERLFGACTVSDALVRGTCTVSSRVLYTCSVGDEPVGDVQIGAALRYDATVFAGVL